MKNIRDNLARLSRLGTVTVAAAAFAGLAMTGSAQAVTYTPDTKLGQALTGNSGDATELAGLAAAAGLNVSDLTLVSKVTGPTVGVDDADNYFVDIAPETTGFFLLKFGDGGLNVPADTFFFQNIGDLTKLVFTSAQVLGIIGGPELCPSKSGNGCDTGRLSHYTTFDQVSTIPVPAALPLLAGGLAALGLMSRRRKRTV